MNSNRRHGPSPRRILVVAPHFKYFVKDFVNAMAKNVEQVDVIVHHNFLSEIAAHIPLGFSRHVRNFTYDRITSLAGTPDNVRVHVISLLYYRPDGSNPNLGEAVLSEFMRMLSNSRANFDLVDGHFTWPCGYVATRIGKMLQIPSFVHLHEEKQWMDELFTLKSNYSRWTWENATSLLAMNRRDESRFQNINRNVTFYHGAYNGDMFYQLLGDKARSSLGFPRSSKIIFALGNLVKRKGFHNLISAMEILARHDQRIICIIGGDGPERSSLNSQIAKLDLRSVVRLAGRIPDGDLKHYYNAADLFAHPSFAESGPEVMYEALACGTPFVGTSVGSIPEVIRPGENGLIVPSRDVEQFAAAIIEGLERKWDRKVITEYGRQFSWDNVCRKVYEWYEQVLTAEILHAAE